MSSLPRGFDAAGHTGNIGTFSIVPQVVDAARGTGVCVIAAGGVTTGRHLAAALALGADGVWTGSLWLTSRESDVNLPLKERLIESRNRGRCLLQLHLRLHHANHSLPLARRLERQRGAGSPEAAAADDSLL
ncbi:MAG: nitronate monooxygenase [Betaproteobacteria bacterium]|nr:nitronate monooxygenase [Betaproteobacteria bacterium]